MEETILGLGFTVETTNSSWKTQGFQAAVFHESG